MADEDSYQLDEEIRSQAQVFPWLRRIQDSSGSISDADRASLSSELQHTFSHPGS